MESSCRKKAKKGAGGKPKKETDMPTAKLKCATKLINQRKLLGALFRDVSEKLEVGLEPELN